MPPLLTRRTTFATLLAAGLPGAASAATDEAPSRRIRALAFDGFTILDPRAITAAVTALFPEHGATLAGAWTNRLFELSWIETAAGRYSGFARLADAALQQVAAQQGLALDPGQRAELVASFGRLPVWPDAPATLARLRQAGIRLALLSNLQQTDLIANMHRNGLDGVMEPPLSTDRVRAFKPSPRAYAMAPDHFRLPREAIGFVAFGGWDALGARWFGYRTAWINRLGAAAETLDPAPDVIGRDLSAALELAGLPVG